MDKLTAMSTFVKVVESGSFTRAADALNVPKARVSQRVSDLEAELRVRLGIAARERALREYSWEAHCRTLDDRIRQLRPTP